MMESRILRDEDVSQVISSSFVPIKVDTARRPDIWQRFAMGAWPSIAFLTPGGDFITGTTYIAARDFLDLLNEVAGSGTAGPAPNPGPLRRAPVTAAPAPGKYFSALATANLDTEHGGFGAAPKFPLAAPGRFLLARAFTGDAGALYALELTLKGMADGGLRSADGGFHRFCARADWSQPARERLLTDQADLCGLYLDAFSFTKDPLYSEAASGVLDFMETCMYREDGGFETAVLEGPRAKRDSQTLSGPNARAAFAFIKASAVLERPGADDLGLHVIDFLFDNFLGERGLFQRSMEKTGLGDPDFLCDQVDVLALLLDAYEASGNTAFINEAQKLAGATVRCLYDLNSETFLDSRPLSDARFPDLAPYRPIVENSQAAIALMRLGGLTGRKSFIDTAEATLAAFAGVFSESGLTAADYALAVMWLNEPKLEIFLSAKNRDELRSGPLLRAARARYHPRKVIVIDGHRPLKSPPPKAPAPASPAAFVRFGDRDAVLTTDIDELNAWITNAA